jgi:hypothetical protein
MGGTLSISNLKILSPFFVSGPPTQLQKVPSDSL